MYAEFYGLETPAFQLTPDARFFFDSAQHRRAMAHLTYGLHHGEGFIIITGEVGAGKTMLLDRLLLQIDRASFVIAKLVTTQFGGDDLLRMVAAEFGLKHEGLTKASLFGRLRDFILSQRTAGRRAILIVDEAQNLSFEALEELRMLSNIVIADVTAMQSFLVGQPQFRETLAEPALDQLRQRVTAAYHLGPLNESDTRAYIVHRLQCVGWKDDPEIAEHSFGAIYRHTDGVPRRINRLCSRLLLNGFLDQSHTISPTDVERVAAELREEIGTVTSVHPEQGTGRADPSKREGPAARIALLEERVAKHDRVIRHAIEIAGRYFSGTGDR
jgi:general secretion pathway protein A